MIWHPDTSTLSGHWGQIEAWDIDSRILAIIAGAQAGKTVFGPWWVVREVARKGPGDYLVVSATNQLFRKRVVPELRKVFEHQLGVGRYWASHRMIELADPSGKFLAKRADDPMWARIMLVSAESRGGLEGTTALAVWADEFGLDNVTILHFEALQRRVAIAEGRILITTTPYNMGYLKTEIYDRWMAGDPDTKVVQFPSYANPAFSRREYNRLKRKMPAWRFDMMHRGLFRKPPGMIYDVWSDDLLCDDFPIPSHWQVVAGVDFGGVNMATLWNAQNPGTGVWYGFRETLEGGKSTSEHCAQANDGAALFESCIFLGGGPSEDQQRRDWQDHGVPIDKPLVLNVEAGIQRFYELIKSGRYRLFRSCTKTRDELNTYRRKLDGNLQPTLDIIDKRTFHLLDCARYAASLMVTSGDLFAFGQPDPDELR